MSLTVLIDTNVMMVALSPRSNMHWIFKRFVKGDFRLVISNEILLEYEEQILKRYDRSVIAEFLLIMSEAPNVIHREPFYKWELIKADPDDNKFVDCAIASAADYIVTHDRHFDVLKQIDFPTVNVITSSEFEKILNEGEGK
jgi:putative PIN family toxin of toxin-antitoxin system